MCAQHILLIEDDNAIATSITDSLMRDGYAVTWRSNGAGGVIYAEQAQPHLIILDVRLPDGSGFDVCRELRRRQFRQPILMLTVRSEEVDKVLGLEMGADAYMTKPFSLRELQATIRALLRRAYGDLSSAESNILLAHDLTIDLDRSEVKRGKTILNLTPTEFRMLVYLARHKGNALSRTQILDAIWGYSSAESERTVNVHIRRLREKIELEPSKPQMILTVPGVGYRLAK